jgi:hypothetical protein
VPNGDGHIVSVVENLGKDGRVDGFDDTIGPVGVMLTMLRVVGRADGFEDTTGSVVVLLGMLGVVVDGGGELVGAAELGRNAVVGDGVEVTTELAAAVAEDDPVVETAAPGAVLVAAAAVVPLYMIEIAASSLSMTLINAARDSVGSAASEVTRKIASVGMAAAVSEAAAVAEAVVPAAVHPAIVVVEQVVCVIVATV